MIRFDPRLAARLEAEDNGEHRGPWAVRALSALTSALGSTPGVMVAVGLIVVWAAFGPLFGFSDAWQLFISTATTLATFRNGVRDPEFANRDARALQVKLDDILSVMREADDKLIGIEDLPEKQIKVLQRAMQVRARRDREDAEPGAFD